MDGRAWTDDPKSVTFCNISPLFRPNPAGRQGSCWPGGDFFNSCSWTCGPPPRHEKGVPFPPHGVYFQTRLGRYRYRTGALAARCKTPSSDSGATTSGRRKRRAVSHGASGFNLNGDRNQTGGNADAAGGPRGGEPYARISAKTSPPTSTGRRVLARLRAP